MVDDPFRSDSQFQERRATKRRPAADGAASPEGPASASSSSSPPAAPRRGRAGLRAAGRCSPPGARSGGTAQRRPIAGNQTMKWNENQSSYRVISFIAAGFLSNCTGLMLQKKPQSGFYWVYKVWYSL